ncbi:MAG: CinA family protein [Kineosporiaceae bacterium]
MTSAGAPGEDTARRLVAAAGARGLTLATAESLTGGAVAAAIVGVPGASEVFRGGMVAYATDLKREWLGVPAELLARCGPVDPDVAAAMAAGARARAGADLGLATTGVAGPGPAGGHPVGTVHVAVVGPGASRVRSLALPGDRPAVRAAAAEAVLTLALALLP